MRVLHIINYLGAGGAERLLVDVLPLYAKAGLSVSLLELTSRHSEPEHVAYLKRNGITCMALGSEPVRSVAVLKQLIVYLRKHIASFEIVHVHLFPSLYFTAFAVRVLGLDKRVRLVFTEHSTQNKRASKAYLRPVERWAYRTFDAVIAISPAVASRLRDIVAPSYVKLIRNGVPVSRFANAESYNPDYFNENFGLSSGDIKLFMTARFKPPKNQELVVKALKDLPSHFHLFFVGSGEEEMDQVVEMVKAEDLTNRIHFLGFRSDVPELMKSADINLLASGYEGMSGVTLEGLASGRPFLGSDVPGINDVVPDNRYLFPAEDAHALAFRISDIIYNKDLKQQMIEDGLNHVAQYDMKKMISGHLNLYKSLIKKQQGRA